MTHPRYPLKLYRDRDRNSGQFRDVNNAVEEAAANADGFYSLLDPKPPSPEERERLAEEERQRQAAEAEAERKRLADAAELEHLRKKSADDEAELARLRAEKAARDAEAAAAKPADPPAAEPSKSAPKGKGA